MTTGAADREMDRRLTGLSAGWQACKVGEGCEKRRECVESVLCDRMHAWLLLMRRLRLGKDGR